jgi:hypothetical protein
MHGLSHAMHSFSTAQKLCNSARLAAILAAFVNKHSRHERTMWGTVEKFA